MGQCRLAGIIEEPDGHPVLLSHQRRMGDHLEPGGFGLPDRGQVAKVPALDISSLGRVGLGGRHRRLAGAELRNQGRHVATLPQQFALGIHHTNVHAVKVFKLSRLPVRGPHLHAALSLEHAAQGRAEVAVFCREFCECGVDHIRSQHQLLPQRFGQPFDKRDALIAQ